MVYVSLLKLHELKLLIPLKASLYTCTKAFLYMLGEQAMHTIIGKVDRHTSTLNTHLVPLPNGLLVHHIMVLLTQAHLSAKVAVVGMHNSSNIKVNMGMSNIGNG